MGKKKIDENLKHTTPEPPQIMNPVSQQERKRKKSALDRDKKKSGKDKLKN